MILTVENKGNQEVIVNLTVDGTVVLAWTIDANSSDVAKIHSNNLNNGLTCNIDINITTTSGSKMNVIVKAWQYQVNP